MTPPPAHVGSASDASAGSRPMRRSADATPFRCWKTAVLPVVTTVRACASSAVARRRAVAPAARTRRTTVVMRLGQDDELTRDVRGVQLAVDREDPVLVGLELDRLRLAARHDLGDVVRRNREAVLVR